MADGNVGFAAGANIGAGLASRELIVFLNPDAIVQPGWAEAMRAGGDGGWNAWMGLVMMESGMTINTSGGVLHYSGIAWAGQAGRPVADGPPAPRAVAFGSGACLAVPANEWRRLGGFPESYFMYSEDVDLSLRIRLGGGKVGVVPAARVAHRYDFRKGGYKWRMLERNRWATILRCYPSALLGVLIPALAVVELAVWVAAIRGRWGRMKLLATADVMRALPRLIGERRAIQRRRVISAAAFAETMTSHLDSPYLDSEARRLGELASAAYWWSALRLLQRLDGRPPRVAAV